MKEKTDKQSLVWIDERFIKWINEVENARDNLQFQPKGHKYVFVRIWDGKAVDIQGLHMLEDAESMLKTVGHNLHEGYYLFDNDGLEFVAEHKNKIEWKVKNEA